jgi:hypothetical protein
MDGALRAEPGARDVLAEDIGRGLDLSGGQHAGIDRLAERVESGGRDPLEEGEGARPRGVHPRMHRLEHVPAWSAAVHSARPNA